MSTGAGRESAGNSSVQDPHNRAPVTAKKACFHSRGAFKQPQHCDDYDCPSDGRLAPLSVLTQFGLSAIQCGVASQLSKAPLLTEMRVKETWVCTC